MSEPTDPRIEIVRTAWVDMRHRHLLVRGTKGCFAIDEQSGSAVCGPATWDQCVEFIELRCAAAVLEALKEPG